MVSMIEPDRYNLVKVKNSLKEYISNLTQEYAYIEHFKIRIKSEKSIKGKLDRKNILYTKENAFRFLNDIVGVRIVCSFISSVYSVASKIEEKYKVIAVKDYIKNPKDNGYRSYHMIVEVDEINIEFQIRTISQDSWASLEHQLMYKKGLDDEVIIKKELKKCSSELASTDISMNVIYELINKEK